MLLIDRGKFTQAASELKSRRNRITYCSPDCFKHINKLIFNKKPAVILIGFEYCWEREFFSRFQQYYRFEI